VAEVLFGTGGLTSTQLGHISFANQNINGGALLDNGELVPIPEARILRAALALAHFIVWRERRRWLAFVAHARSRAELSSGRGSSRGARVSPMLFTKT
jgi:hypothetical protein